MQTPHLDAVFYHEMWSLPNETELPEFLKTVSGERTDEERKEDYHCFARVDGQINDLQSGPLGTYQKHERIYTIDMTKDLLSEHSFTAEDLVPGSKGDILKTWDIVGNGRMPGVVPVKFTDGCPFSCAFCDASYLQPHHIGPRQVVDYLESASGNTGARFFFFLNRQLNIQRGYLEEFCHEIIRRRLNIAWTDSVNLDMLPLGCSSLLRDAGCVRLCCGIESLSERLRRIVGRPTDVVHVKKGLCELHEAGVWVQINLIVGLPHESGEEVQDTELFLREYKDVYQWVLLSKFKLYPKSRFAEEPLRYGLRVDSEHAKVCLDKDFGAFSYEYCEEGGRSFAQCQAHINDTYDRLNAVLDPTFQTLAGNFPLIALAYDKLREKSRVLQFISALAKQDDSRHIPVRTDSETNGG